jgi:hypothetical protein
MINYYIDLIKQAIEAIGPEYYRVRTIYKPIGIPRERVFCYEFYHQLRCRMANDQRLTLHGEIDKRGHKDFRVGHNPDFVLHVPETHTYNAIVIEVKGKLTNQSSINAAKYDIEKLLLFVNQNNYQAGVFILFNHDLAELSNRIGTKLVELQANPGAEAIHILAIRSDTRRCEAGRLIELSIS